MSVWRCEGCRAGKGCVLPEPCLPERESQAYLRGYADGLRDMRREVVQNLRPLDDDRLRDIEHDLRLSRE